MPLSEHEERILAEIERQLAAEDPAFVARNRSGRRVHLSRAVRMRLAIAAAVLGVISLFGLTFNIGFGVVGLALLLAAILLGATAVRESPRDHSPAEPPSSH